MDRDLAMALRLDELQYGYSSLSTRVHIKYWQRRIILSCYYDWEQGWKSKGTLLPMFILPRHKFVNVDK